MHKTTTNNNTGEWNKNMNSKTLKNTMQWNNPAPRDILLCHKIKVIHNIVSLTGREACREILITICWLPKLLNNNLLLLLLNLITMKRKVLFAFSSKNFSLQSSCTAILDAAFVGYFYKKYHMYFNTHLCVSIIS